MKITEKQIIMLMRVCEGSLRIVDRTDMNLFGYNQETRVKLLNDLYNQQNEVLIIDPDKN